MHCKATNERKWEKRESRWFSLQSESMPRLKISFLWDVNGSMQLFLQSDEAGSCGRTILQLSQNYVEDIRSQFCNWFIFCPGKSWAASHTYTTTAHNDDIWMIFGIQERQMGDIRKRRNGDEQGIYWLFQLSSPALLWESEVQNRKETESGLVLAYKL